MISGLLYVRRMRSSGETTELSSVGVTESRQIVRVPSELEGDPQVKTNINDLNPFSL